MNGPPAMKPPTLPPSRPPPPKPPAQPARQAKTFAVKEWTSSGQGKKILLYGPNGMGKTTLAAMAPGAIFIGFDDGGRETINPLNGKPLLAIPGIETFEDLRDAMHQPDLFPAGATVVVDTITRAETTVVDYILRTVKTEGGKTAENIEGYGWGKGYVHLLDPVRLLLSDLDSLVRRGVNILLLGQQSQATVANLQGLDYSQDGPTLESRPKSGANVRAEICGWVDNIFRIGYPDVSVEKASKEAKKGKASGTTERVIFTEPEVYFVAKNRMNGTLPAIMPFATRNDNSIWRAVFEGERFE